MSGSLQLFLLLAIALICVIIILMALTAILSHLNACVLKLIQENALLEQRIRELEGGGKGDAPVERPRKP